MVRLTEGKTEEVEVIVTAEDGSTAKTYTVLMRRLSADDATLAQLEVSSGSLNPPFSPLVTSYDCSLPCGIETASPRVKAEDPNMKVSTKDGLALDAIQLNPGRTLVEIVVSSVSGKNTSVYSITLLKSRFPSTVQLKEKGFAFQCAVCCNVVHQPSRIKGGSHLYCKACLEQLTRTSKVDPFTGKKIEEEGWLLPDLECDGKLAKQAASCITPNGVIEGSMQQMGSKLQAERLKHASAEEVHSAY